MELNHYQQEALKSVAITERSVAALAHRSLGLSGEAGIVANSVKKIIRDKNGHLDEADMQILKEKLGDALYYIAVLAEYCDLTLEEVAQANVEKSAKFMESRK